MARFIFSFFLLISLQGQAQVLPPDQMQSWRQLLHFDASGHSAIHSADFFLSPTGRDDAQSELQATIAAMQLPANTTSADQHAQCRFPGRFLFLQQQGLLEGVAPIRCNKFEEFSASGQVNSVSLIFATGFLGNPASYYGHLLLRLNTNQSNKTTTDLEETALNFGAAVPANEGMLMYIAKGLTGGYDSSFTHMQYFYHSQNYGESELRDLWEYELELPPFELKLLTAHIWEVMNADFTYYFFNRNCAYRFGELLEIVLKKPLTTPNRWWETPQAVVQRVAAVQINGKSIVKQVKFHPSRLSRLYQRYQKLDEVGVDTLQHFVEHPEKLSTEALQQLPLSVQYDVVDTLVDYYQVIRKAKEGDKDPHNAHYNQTLYQRYMLPPKANELAFASSNNPERGRPPSYINAGFSRSSDYGNQMRLWIRPAYYDALDATYGHVPHSSLSMGEVELAVNANEIAIKQLNLVKIDSVRLNLTGLPGDRHYSWYLDAGAAQLQAGCLDCLATKFNSGIGYAKAPMDESWVVAGYVGAGFHDSRALARGSYLSARLQTSWYATDRLRMMAVAEQRWMQNGETRPMYQLKGRWSLASDLDVRLEYSYLADHDISLSMGWYY